MKTTRRYVAWAFATFALFLSPLLSINAATISWTNTAGGNWSVAANWSGGALPTVSDDVLISVSGTYTVTQDVHVAVASLTLGGGIGFPMLTNAGAVLTLNGASLIHSNGVLGFGNGTLATPGLLAVQGRCLWGGGSWSGLALILPGGALDLAGNVDKLLSGSVTNAGVITWIDGNPLLLASGRIENQADGLFEIRNDQNLALYSGVPAVVNRGTIRKSGGGGTAVIGVPLTNSGTLDVQSGRMAYVSGSSFGSGTAFTGPGTNLLSHGTVTFSGAVSAENLEITSGVNVAGTGTLSGTILWTGGTISGAMTIDQEARLDITGTADHALSGSLNNRGQMIWSGANTILMANGQLTNLVDGVLAIHNNRTLTIYSGAPTFRNFGTISKDTGGGDTVIGVPLINSGVLAVSSGRLAYVNGSVFNSGTAFVGTGTNLLSHGTVTLNGSVDSENLEITTDVHVAGQATLHGDVKWTGGTISGAMTIAQDAAVNITGTADRALSGSLNNQGKMFWSGANTIFMVDGRLTNQANGYFEIRNNQGLASYSGAPTVHNFGEIRKSTGSGDTILGVALVNSGTLQVDSGRVAYASGSQFHSGTVFGGQGSNFLYSGTVTFSGSLYSENLEIASVVNVAGISTLSGMVRWTGGTISGALTIDPNGAVNITGTADRALSGSLNNHGFLIWSGANTILMANGRLTNHSGGVFEILNNRVLAFYNGAPIIHNLGFITKSAEDPEQEGDTIIGVPLINSGALEANHGRLAYSGGSQFRSGTSFGGNGTNLLHNGDVTLDGAIFSENLELAGANILGTNTLAGLVHWISGGMGGGSSVTLLTNGVLDISGTADHYIRGTLVNSGLVNWSGANVIYLADVGTVSNLASGTFEATADGVLAHYSGVSTFRNQGVLRKAGGTGVTTINLSTFDNTGTVYAQSGTIGFGAYRQTGGRLQFGLSSRTNFGQMRFGQPVALTNTLAANLLGGFRPKAGDAFAVISYFPSYTGAFTGFDLPTEAAWQTNSSIYSANAVTLTVLNARPAIDPITDRTIDEQVLSSFTITGSDPDSGQTLSYALVNPPDNAGINASSGLFSWTPGEAQGPSTNLITVRATDNGSPALDATNTFTIVVREINRRPISTTLGSFSPDELTPFSLTAPLATDPDVPANSLRFEFIDAPDGMGIHPDTGAIAWTPTEAQGPSLNTIRVRITDNGSPALSTTNTFVVQVAEVNVAPELASPGEQVVVPGETLVLTNRASDVDLPANTLTFSLLEPPAGAGIDPGTGRLTWKTGSSDAGTTNRIAVVVRDNGVPNLSATQSFQTIVLPRPRLAVARKDGAVQLSWPALYTGYVPQDTTNLSAPLVWADLTNLVTLEGTNRVVIEPVTANQKFFRLVHP